MPKISYYSRGITQTVPTRDLEVIEALRMIAGEEWAEAIHKLRHASDKHVRQTLKRELPYFTFSGTFRKRHADHLIHHSGILVLDLDDLDALPDTASIRGVYEIKQHLKKDPYVLALFVSPSGTGLKILVRIPGQNHLNCFYALTDYMQSTYGLTVDPSGKDVSRACYMSHDPDVYINNDALIWETVSDPSIKIDYETGDVITKTADLESMDGKTLKTYERAKWVVEQVVAKGVDLTVTYDDWMLIGLSLSTFGEPGRGLFHQISQFHPDYKPRETDLKFDDFVRNGRFENPAKFFQLAKQHGIETRKTVRADGAEASGAETGTIQFTPPLGCTMTELMKEDVIRYGFMEWQNQYWMVRWEDNKKGSFTSISNYVIRPLFLILSNMEPKRLYEMRNVHGHTSIVDMPAAHMVSAQSFCAVIESKGNYLMKLDRSIFHRLKTKWYDLTRNAEEIKVLGWHKDGFYAFSNGIFYNKKFRGIDEYGVIEKVFYTEEQEEYKKYYFIPAHSDIYKDEEAEYENEKKFVYVGRTVRFDEWSTLFVQTHGENGVVALMYYVTSLFRDIVYDRFKFFPHLFGFGPPGTGKSTLGWSISYLFGKERKPFNLNAGTAPGFYRTFAQFRNAIQWFDEYANSIDIKRIQDLKNAYDGAGHVKGDFTAGGNSNKTVSTPIHSACYISGQELPTADNALFKRCVLLQFYKTEYTDEERGRAKRLREMEEHALTHITAALTSLRDEVEERYYTIYDEVATDIKGVIAQRYGLVEERLIANMVILVAMMKTLEKELPWPMDYTTVRETAIRMIYAQNKLISRSAETSQFWDTVQYLYNSHQISDTSDFCIRILPGVKLRLDRNETVDRMFGTPTELLFLSLSKIHVLYMKALREQGEKKGMNKESLIHYLQHSKGYIGAVNKISYGDRSSSGYVFDYAVLEDMGVDLKKQKITASFQEDVLEEPITVKF